MGKEKINCKKKFRGYCTIRFILKLRKYGYEANIFQRLIIK